MKVFTQPIDIHVYDLLAALALEARSYLGIGVQEGVCVAHVAEANPTIELMLCDTWGPEHGGTNRGSHAHVEARLDAVGHHGGRRYLDGRSEVLIPALDGTHALWDLAYIDGAHDTPHAWADLSNVWPRLARRGVIVLHDIWMPPVLAALSQWSRGGASIDTIQLFTAGTGTALIQKLNG